MMSTMSGFIIGVISAGVLTLLYGEQLSERLQEAVAQHPEVAAQLEEVATTAGLEDLKEVVPRAQQLINSVTEATGKTQHGLSNTLTSSETSTVEPSSVPEAPVESRAAQHHDTSEVTTRSLEQRWAAYADQHENLEPSGEFPWRVCFQRAAASYDLPESLLLAIASGESNFDPAARSDADAVGLMQVRWPLTSKHLGIHREADLYDPCTNVDAGARYISELSERYDNNYHLMVAAYNYGPNRISAGQVPEGARWYSQNIYQHLQRILGREHIPTSELIERPSPANTGREVLMTFNQPYRARDYLAFLRTQFPEFNLQQQSESLGFYDVVLLYDNKTERNAALSALSAAGVTIPDPRSTGNLLL